jgi:hypothetical protein
MPNIDLSILNQRQTPAFYADTLANRPAAGFVGRIFVSTNTFAFYRDNGTGWDLIGGPGTGTITGSGATGQIALWDGASTITGDTGLTYNGTANSLTASQFIVTGGTSSQFLKANGSLDSNTYNTGSGAVNQVAYWNGTNSITGDNGLYYDSTNDFLGIATNAPGAALDVHSTINVIAQLNQLTATNNSLLAFQNSSTGLWRIGNFYNAGANDWGIFDVVGAIQPVTVKKTTGQVLIGTSTVGSGKLVVASATGDNGVQIVGASAPSLRIDNAESGPTKRAGFGISTATNNFIQGSADRDFCMFNGSTTASPILFGIYGTTNVQEAARISAARNFIIGGVTDSGEKLQVNGTSLFTSIASFSNLVRPTTNFGSDLGSSSFKWSEIWGYSLNLSGGTTVQNRITLSRGNDDIAQGMIIGYSNITTYRTTTPLSDPQTDFSLRQQGSDGTRTVLYMSDSGNIGINTVSPTSLLTVQGRGVSPLVMSLNSANPNCDIFLQSSVSTNAVRLRNGTDDFSVFTNGVQRTTVSSSGNILIDTTTDYGYKLTIAGNSMHRAGQPQIVANNIAGATNFFNFIVQRNDNFLGALGLDSSDRLAIFNSTASVVGYFNQTTGVYVPTSDFNKKKDFEQSEIGLNAILSLKPTLYRMTNEENTQKHLGFIAQEVKDFIPQAYQDNGDFIGLDYQPIIATLVKAIQELNIKIENLKN